MLTLLIPTIHLLTLLEYVLPLKTNGKKRNMVYMNSFTTYLPYIIYVSIAGYYILILLYMNTQKSAGRDDEMDPNKQDPNVKPGDRKPNM